MNYIIDFINSEVGKSQIYKELECSDDEVKILKFLTKNYIDGNSNISVYSVLCGVFGEENYRYLNYLGSIKSLSEIGYINQNYGIFRQNEHTKGIKSSKLGLLYAEIELSEIFLKLLEDGGVQNPFPQILEYTDHLEYLKDQFYRIELYQKRLEAQSKESLTRLDDKISKLENIISKRIKLSKIPLMVEQIFKINLLNSKEQIIFLALLKEEYSNEFDFLREMNTLIGLISDNEIEKIKNRALLEEGAKLIANFLIDYDEVLGPFGGITRSFFINEEIIQSIMHPQKQKQSKKIMLETIVKDSEIFELIEPQSDIDDVVLNPKTKELLHTILKQLDRRVIARLNSWGIKNRRGIDAKIIFYGPAGTGKTMSAISLAKNLKKKVLGFDCSKILSKYIGESEQNVRKIFDIYNDIRQKTKSEPVLLLNEADQFLSSRMETSTNSADKMHNQMQNIFLEQIEKFEGILIATTNLIQSFDGAFSRRFDYKIEFKRPNYDERVALWRKIIPENASFDENFSLEKLAEFELSGAQIMIVLKNTAMKVAVRDDEIFTFEDFRFEILREISSTFGEDKKVGLL